MNIEDPSKPVDPELAKCTYTGNNCITSEYKQKRTLVEFLIEYGIACITSTRSNAIFKPIPKTWQFRRIKPAEAISKLGINTNIESLLSTITYTSNDELLVEKIGVETYGFIKFLLHMNNAIQIEKINIIYAPADPDDTITKPNGEMVSISRVNQFKFTYTSDIESRFQASKTVYRFHGTPAENVIPILANGLKNCSEIDELRLNGAAYGNGIYLSDSAEFSLGYCRFSHDGHMAMLIYEVIDSPKWFKTKGIYVIDDENALVLRYIVIIKNYTINDSKILGRLTSLVNGGAIKEAEKKKEAEKQVVLSKAFNKRLMMEYKFLMKKPTDELGFCMKLAEDDNLRKWIVTITKIDNATLETQMRRLNVPFIELEITFPEGYPIEPPFPRVIYPRFKSLTGHITAGGSICMEAISKKGWVPTTNMEALITQIKIVLAEGDAKIDEANSTKRYDIAEAREAFQRAMATHGWN